MFILNECRWRFKVRFRYPFFLTLCLVILSFYHVCYAGQLPLIERLSIKNGLSNNEVRCIFQDHRGLMWFGTYDGLNRYDGYEFLAYRNKPGDSNSVIHSYINTIAEDHTYHLWVGARQGISILDPVRQEFSYAYIRSGRNSQRVTAYIKQIYTDQDGNMYAAAQNEGLFFFSQGTHTGRVISFIKAGTEPGYNPAGIAAGPDKKTYVFVSDVGLCVVNNKKQLQVINGDIKDANCIIADNNGIWIGGKSGLFHYNIAERQLDISLLPGQVSFSSTRITAILRKNAGEIWIATDGGGINIYNRKTGQVTYLVSGTDHHSLSSDAVYALYRDVQHRIWIGTLRGGLNIIDQRKAAFQNILSEPVSGKGLLNNFVKSVAEDEQGRIWIGTDGGGLTIWNRNTHSFLNYVYNPNKPEGISNNFITSIHRDSNNRMWLTTYAGGIMRFEPQNGTFKKYNGLNPGGKNQYRLFWTLFEDNHHRLWASGLQEGLFLYNEKKDNWELFDAQARNIISFCEDREHQLWAGTFQGLLKLDLTTKHHRFYPIGTPVRSLLEDRAGNFWLGTEGGLMRYDRKYGNILARYTTANGLCNNNVLSLEQDYHGHLWMGTYNGLAQFNPATQKFTTYSESDGVVNKEYNFNASVHLKDGELAFGGINGLTLFNPDEVLPIRHNPALVINQIKINNKPISAAPGYISSVRASNISAIRLPYEEAAITVDFAAIEFTAPEKINYRYMMEGWDKQWHNAGQNRQAIYTHLSPGTYTLRLQCSNTERQWLAKSLSLQIDVLPPWYRTWWAYTAYFCLIVFTIGLFIRYRFREARLKYEVQLARSDAEKRRILQEKEKELHEKRIEFFTDISHEFRTPLSLIINPARDLAAAAPDENNGELDLIYRNSRRLLSLVDQLLLFRKADAGISQLSISKLDMEQVCHEVFLCFVQQAKVAGIACQFKSDLTDPVIYADREKIEIVIFNLIANAIKYTPAGGNITVQLSDEPDDISICVIDTGTGIPKEVGDQLFTRFYRSRKADRYGKAGFGIGLYLAKTFATDHQGDLTYESVTGKGTTFTLKLKKGKDHFGSELLTDVDVPASELLSELSGPQQQAKTKKPELTDFKAENIFTDRKAVLVIDDDADIRNYISGILQPSFVVYQAGNGEDGIKTAREHRPDLIICDVMMEGLNGIEVCSIIKKDPELNYIPMILLTGSSSPERKLKGLESGADDYIEKPFEKDILVARVINLIQIRNNLQNYFYNAVTLRANNIAISEEYKVFLQRCIEIVENNLTNADFSIKVLAREVGMSHPNLYRKVKSLSGHTVNSFIRFIRLRKAAEMLIQTDLNVNQVAIETGFNNIKYFRAQFFKLFGQNPSEFVKQKRPRFQKRFNVTD